MNNATKTLQDKISYFCAIMEEAYPAAKESFKMYFATDASSLVGDLSTDSTAATVATKLTKGQYTGGITYVENLVKFFENENPFESVYLETSLLIRSGIAAAGAELSPSVEYVGDKLDYVAGQSITAYYLACDIVSSYSSSSISACFTGASSSLVIFGAEMTKAELDAGVVLAEQFKKLMDNETVTQGDYLSTLVSWRRFR